MSGGTFHHGVHPDEHKDQTAHLTVRRMPFVDRYVLPVGQHIGAPAKAVVRVGQAVQRGQLIAEPGGYVSTALHSPVTGQVSAVAPRRHPNGQLVQAIEIEADRYATQQLEPKHTDWTSLTLEGFISAVQSAGLVGLGGAAFPSHVKYKLPEGKRCQRLVINGCECEPYLTCDHRVMVERPESVIRGVEVLSRHLEADKSFIGVELNKPDAIEALRRAAAGRNDIEITPVRVKYPQGAEKMLINALFGQEVPAGKLPIDLGIVVNNVATMAALADASDRGCPLVERVITVAGPGIRRPANLIVPLGTPVRAVLEQCGGLLRDARQVVMGGPMMGTPLASLDVPVLKGTSGLLAFTEVETGHPPEYACIRCGRCLEACANFLNPSRLARLARSGRYDLMEAGFALDCMECGGCSYACPSGIPIVQLIRAAKSAIRESKRS